MVKTFALNRNINNNILVNSCWVLILCMVGILLERTIGCKLFVHGLICVFESVLKIIIR